MTYFYRLSIHGTTENNDEIKKQSSGEESKSEDRGRQDRSGFRKRATERTTSPRISRIALDISRVHTARRQELGETRQNRFWVVHFFAARYFCLLILLDRLIRTDDARLDCGFLIFFSFLSSILLFIFFHFDRTNHAEYENALTLDFIVLGNLDFFCAFLCAKRPLSYRITSLESNRIRNFFIRILLHL